MFTGKNNVSPTEGGIRVTQLQAAHNHLSLTANNHLPLACQHWQALQHSNFSN